MTGTIQFFSQLGNSLGILATLVVFWLYIQINNYNKRIEKLEQENNLLKTTLSDIRADVAYIKGKLED